MKTALARRNEWARQLKRLQEMNRREEPEPELKFKSDKNTAHNVVIRLDKKAESESH
jgi:hypothetical protein